MNDTSRPKLMILGAGDIFLMYLSLVTTLVIRYRAGAYHELVRYHLLPFSILFVLWMVIFSLAGFYDLKNLKNSLTFKKNFSFLMLAILLTGIMFFYAAPAFGVSPKTNLLLLIAIFGITDYAWRHIYNIVLVTTMTPLDITIIGAHRDIDTLVDYIRSNPQLGYRIGQWIESIDRSFADRLRHTDLLVIPDYIKRDRTLIKIIYNTMFRGIDVKDVSAFYEEIFGKIPISELEESWLIENLAAQHTMFDSIKRPVELLAAVLAAMALSPVFAGIFAGIRLTSRGSAIYRQERVGRYEKRFVLYKFRTMVPDAEAAGPRWAQDDDRRITPLGRLLRRTHLDELPQLINVIKGDLSFVGPRPERPEFVEQLKKRVPYYEVRHIVKPGITGWAQINYRYAASVHDTYEKLQYDIYYLKKRSLVFDMIIILKTLKTLFINPV
ncbi:MAG: exopolysaccharide biosynthesis polyprenyl glycosylphosphotransferase [Deltaproteobacteria bacterium]|nr:exopolysaccharide biosynthesis polyprenyl glycosylphosphotransferase [Deltaproteobacteria bacterium]